jgi:multidrug efflux system membrane fusion protein
MSVQTTTTPETGLPPLALPEPKQQKLLPPPEKKGRGWLWLMIIIALGAAAYYFLVLPRLKSAQSSTAPAGKGGGKKGGGTIPVVAARAKRGSIGVYYSGLGVVTPIYTVTIKSRVDGQLMKIQYKEGELVREGDLLAEIDPRPYQVQLEQAEGQQGKDQAALDNARVDLARYQKLWAQKAIPQQQLATQEATVAQDESTLKSDQSQIDSAKLNLVYSKITSPISGRIGLRLVDPGNIVHASDANGLLVITQVQPISVIYTIAEDQLQPVLKKMRAGQKLTVEAWDRELKNKIATGYLATHDNQIDQTTGTLKLRALFDNNDDSLFPNQFVNARMLVEQKTGVTLVPGAAVQRNSQNIFVYIVKPNQTVTVHTVTVGTTEGDLTEITSGLNPDDVVVTDGVDKLQEGTRVAAKIPGETPAASDDSPRGAGKRGKKKE